MHSIELHCFAAGWYRPSVLLDDFCGIPHLSARMEDVWMDSCFLLGWDWSWRAIIHFTSFVRSSIKPTVAEQE